MIHVCAFGVKRFFMKSAREGKSSARAAPAGGGAMQEQYAFDGLADHNPRMVADGARCD